MAKTPVSLERYFLTKLDLENLFADPDAEINYSMEFEFELRADPESERRALQMNLMISGECGAMPAGYQVRTGIVGIFSFPEDASDEDREKALLFHGASLLYGILRGYLGTVTGPFGTGILVMPTVNMYEVISDWLREKVATSTATKKRKTRCKK